MQNFRTTRHTKFLLNYHFVWIPKYRRKILGNNKVKKLIFKTIKELSLKHDFEVLALEIMPDHIHLFLSALPIYSPSKIMNIIKGVTGKKICNTFPSLGIKGSVWTNSYFVSTAGSVSSDTIKKYIDKQNRTSLEY